MEDWKIVLFIHFCTRYNVFGDLNLTNQQLIRLHEECLVMAEYIQDCFTQIMVNISLGVLCRKAEKFTEAISYLEKALAMAVHTNERNQEACAYGELGLVHKSLGNSKQALLYVEKCLAIAISTGLRPLEVDAYRSLGMIYHSMGEYQTSINCHEKQLDISQECDDKVKGYAYYHLGNNYWSLDMYEEAKKWYEKCLLVISSMEDKEVEVNVYDRLSECYQSSGEHGKAIRYYEKLLHLVKGNNDNKREAEVYEKLGDVYKSLGKDDEAIKQYTKQLVLAEAMDYKEEIKSAHENLGNVYSSTENYFDAIKHYEKLLAIFIKTDDKELQSVTYYRLGLCSRLVSDYDKVIKYCHEYLRIASDTSSKDSKMDVYNRMGGAYHSLGKDDEAICYLEKAIRIAEEMDDKTSTALMYIDKGQLFFSLDKFDKALECCLIAIDIAREMGNKEYELISNNVLGGIYCEMGKFHEGIQCYEKIWELERETGPVENLRTTYVYANMGLAYKSVGQFENAVKCFEKNLNICQKRGDREGEGNVYRCLGNMLLQQGKYQEAMGYLKKSLRIAKEKCDKEGEGNSFLGLGNAYCSMQDTDQALKCFERSLVIAKEMGKKKMECLVNLGLASLYDKCMENQKAIDCNEKALTLAVSIGDKENELIVCHNLGISYFKKAIAFKEILGNEMYIFQQSKKYLEQSLQCGEWLFKHLHDRDDCKITIMDKFIQNYKLLTSVLIETGEINDALIVSDQCRARALSDLLEAKYSEVPQNGKNVNLSYAEVDSLLHLSKAEFCVLYFAVHVHLDSVAIWVLAHQKPLFFLELNGQEFGQSHSPTSQHEISQIISEVVFAAYDDMNVRNTLTCEDRSLDHMLENQQLTKSDDCFVRGDGQKEEESRAPDQDKQEETPNKKKNGEDNKNPLEMLYTELIAPVMQNLTHDEVVIVPDGPLYMVPFAALRDPETGLFLSEMKRIRLAPSLTTLKSLQECPSDYHSTTGALVVGDPDLGTVMFQGEETTFWSLPKARHEAQVIANILDVVPLIGPQATKDVIKQRLHEGVAIIHIAAHGSTKGEIVLAPRTLTEGRKIPEEEDYMLTMQEVQETGIRAQLVVLSCCHSGRGEIRAEGIVGISRGFLAAGARAVVASLWAIDDEATLNFMVSFYTFLKMGNSASKSLQEAMNDVRGDSDEPRHWAPFFLIGDDVTINL